MAWVLINAENKIVNVIAYDGVTAYAPPDGLTLTEAPEGVTAKWTYDGATFSPPGEDNGQ